MGRGPSPDREFPSLARTYLRRVEEVGALGGSFDQIVCSGVLHHLADPTLRLRALRAILTPGDALQLMVYGSYGRFGISMMRDFSRRLSVATSTEDIDDLVQTLRELPMGHPMSHILRKAPDSGDRDALADALLKPRETSYIVPELFGLLEDANLRFGRWVRQGP